MGLMKKVVRALSCGKKKKKDERDERQEGTAAQQQQRQDGAVLTPAGSVPRFRNVVPVDWHDMTHVPAPAHSHLRRYDEATVAATLSPGLSPRVRPHTTSKLWAPPAHAAGPLPTVRAIPAPHQAHPEAATPSLGSPSGAAFLRRPASRAGSMTMSELSPTCRQTACLPDPAACPAPSPVPESGAQLAHQRRSRSQSFRSISISSGGTGGQGGASVPRTAPRTEPTQKPTPSPCTASRTPLPTTPVGAPAATLPQPASQTPPYLDILDELTRRRTAQPGLFVQDDCAIVTQGTQGQPRPPPQQPRPKASALPPPPPPPPPPAQPSHAVPAGGMSCVLDELAARFEGPGPQLRPAGAPRPAAQPASVESPCVAARACDSLQQAVSEARQGSSSFPRVSLSPPGTSAQASVTRAGSRDSDGAAGVWAQHVDEGCPSTCLPMAARQSSLRVYRPHHDAAPTDPATTPDLASVAPPPPPPPPASTAAPLVYAPQAVHSPVMNDVPDVTRAEPAKPAERPAPARRGAPAPAPAQVPQELVTVLPAEVGGEGAEEEVHVAVEARVGGVPEMLADAWRGTGREAIWNAMASQRTAEPQGQVQAALDASQRGFDASRRSSQHDLTLDSHQGADASYYDAVVAPHCLHAPTPAVQVAESEPAVELSPLSSLHSAPPPPPQQPQQPARHEEKAAPLPPTTAAQVVSLTLSHGDEYRGTVQSGVPHGHGELRYTNGNHYEGELRDGLKWGRGVFQWRNGDCYRGEFVKDVFHGRGCFTFASAETSYSGLFRNGMFAGEEAPKTGTPDANTPLPPAQAPSPPAHTYNPHAYAAPAAGAPLDLSAPDEEPMWRDAEAEPHQAGKLVRSATHSRLPSRSGGGSKALFSTLKTTVPVP
eukprot:TRINITY_DN3378_c1_g1_i1.p1 TRINITY_DN3378_c1_g1~~TRINITY_DN3378_c1_g1_i1.p1  ORF type:complete len:883 (+),score=219.50 TRINITY_DN3378_c1_g1_i1:48-2696(+)